MDAPAPALSCQSDGLEDLTLAAARRLLPLARQLRDDAKRQADAIGRFERRFGPPETRHLARLLDDLWMAADSFVCDVSPGDPP
ncbi:MAG TPA: hypothetical protein VF342_08980 [Alphaproteobacteria bacterium]